MFTNRQILRKFAASPFFMVALAASAMGFLSAGALAQANLALPGAAKQVTSATFEVRIALTKSAGSLAASCATLPSSGKATGSTATTQLSCLSTVLAALRWPASAAEGQSFIGRITVDGPAPAVRDNLASAEEDSERRGREIEVIF